LDTLRPSANRSTTAWGSTPWPVPNSRSSI